MKSLLSMKRLREINARIPFFSSLDLLTVEEDGLMIGVSGKQGLGYWLEGVDYLLYDDSRIETFLNELKQFLHQVPEGVVLSFHKRSSAGNESLLQEHADLFSETCELENEILQAKLKAFREQRLIKKELFLFVTIQSKDFSLKTGNSQKAKKILEDFEVFLKLAFQGLGIGIKKLAKEDLLRWYYETLNPSLSETVPYKQTSQNDLITYPRFQTLRSAMLLHPPAIYENSFFIDGFYHVGVNLRILPESSNVGMVKVFEEALVDDCEWVLTLQKPNEEKEISKMRIKANLAKASAFFRLSEDPFAKESARQYEAFLSDMAERGESVFEISLSVLVKAKNQHTLEAKKETVLKAFSKLGGAIGVWDHFEHDRLVLSHLPLQGDFNPVKFKVLSGALARLLPLGEEWKGTKAPEILLKNYRDEALCLDLFDPGLPAKHALMVGSTGSGKSFTTNYLLSHFLTLGPKNHIVIIDMGGSYRKLTKIFSGSYLEIECSEEYALNPFPEKKRLFYMPDQYDSDLLGFLTTLLEKMVTENSKLTTSDLRILECAVLQVYKFIPDEARPLLEDVQNILRNYFLGDEEDRKRAYSFSKSLSIWTEGRFGKLLNRPSKLSLENRLIVFDLAKLSAHPELQSILFFVIRSAISRKLYDMSLRKMVVIDEGWRFFNDEIGSKLIEELYRTARKTNGLILSISQSPEDFLESKASTAILANSYVKYVLKLQKSHELLSRFDLNPNEIRAVKELETRPGIFSEFFIKFFNHSAIAKIEPSGLDYWIATTDPEDYFQEEKLRNEFPALSDFEILKKLADLYPHGVKKNSPLKELR